MKLLEKIKDYFVKRDESQQLRYMQWEFNEKELEEYRSKMQEKRLSSSENT